MNKTCYLLLTVAVLLSVSSCMDVETELSFRDAASGSLAVSYLIDSRALQLGIFDDDVTILPLPVHRSDFEQTAATHPELELDSYRARTRDGVTRINAVYRFESIAALETALGPRSELRIDTTAEGTRLRQRLFAGVEQGRGTRSREFVDEFLGQASFSMSVRAPGAVITSNLGEVDGRVVRLRYGASELVLMEESLNLELVWE